VKKKKGTFPRILAGASAGAFLGLAAYLFLKSDKADQDSKNVSGDKQKHNKQEKLFI
jgi:hypothetical protein